MLLMKRVKIHMSLHFKTPKLRQIIGKFIEYDDETNIYIHIFSVTYTYSVPTTCFGHTHGHLQGNAIKGYI